MATPTPIAVWASWPQACISPGIFDAKASPCGSGIGKASMSQRKHTIGPCDPTSTVSPVRGVRGLGDSPSARSRSTRSSVVLNSSCASSGCMWMVRRQLKSLAPRCTPRRHDRCPIGRRGRLGSWPPMVLAGSTATPGRSAHARGSLAPCRCESPEPNSI